MGGSVVEMREPQHDPHASRFLPSAGKKQNVKAPTCHRDLRSQNIPEHRGENEAINEIRVS